MFDYHNEFLNWFFVERYQDDSYTAINYDYLDPGLIHTIRSAFLFVNMAMLVENFALRGFWNITIFFTYWGVHLTNASLILSIWATL